MFDDLTKLKERTKKLAGLVEEKNDPSPGTDPASLGSGHMKPLPEKPDTGIGFPFSEELDPDRLGERADAIYDEGRVRMEQGMVETEDASKRAVGKVRGTFKPPRTEVERGLMKETVHFFCADCSARLGPMETRKWKNILKLLMGGVSTAAGVVLVNPILVFKGASSLSSVKKDDRGMIEKLKGDAKLKENARNFLVQCEYCGEWVCSACYLAERTICNRCGRERGMFDGLVGAGSGLFGGQG